MTFTFPSSQPCVHTGQQCVVPWRYFHILFRGGSDDGHCAPSGNGANWQPEGRHGQLSAGAALLGWWPCCTQKSLKTSTHGAKPSSAASSGVSPTTGGGGRPPHTAFPAKAFIDLGAGPKSVKVLLAFCKLHINSRSLDGIAWSCENLVLPVVRHPAFSLKSPRAEGRLTPQPHTHWQPALQVQYGLAPRWIPARDMSHPWWSGSPPPFFFFDEEASREEFGNLQALSKRFH